MRSNLIRKGFHERKQQLMINSYNKEKLNYTIVFDHEQDKLDILATSHIQFLTYFYFETIEDAEHFIEAVGEDVVKSYFQGGRTKCAESI